MKEYNQISELSFPFFVRLWGPHDPAAAFVCIRTWVVMPLTLAEAQSLLPLKVEGWY